MTPSALARLRYPEVAVVLAPLIESGVEATYGVIEFELGWATRSSAEFDRERADRDAGYEWMATHDEDWRRAIDVQGALWHSGRTRAVGLPDLLIAAVAEPERVATGWPHLARAGYGFGLQYCVERTGTDDRADLAWMGIEGHSRRLPASLRN